MDATLMSVLLIVALLAVAGVLLMRRNRSRELKQRFGPEYEHAVDEHGSRTKAEAELAARQKRVAKLNIVPLSTSEAMRFREAWRALQARFVDDPHGVLKEADRLVCELMEKRGYPMGHFEARAADISVDHPAVVEHYRAAHAIALADHDGLSDTESLRQAVVHYRALFADLLEVGDPQPVQEKPKSGFGKLLGGRDHAMARGESRRPNPRGSDRPS